MRPDGGFNLSDSLQEGFVPAGDRAFPFRLAAFSIFSCKFKTFTDEIFKLS